MTLPSCISFVLMLILLFMSNVVLGDPTNLVQNGEFEVESFIFGSYPSMDVISNGIRTLLPFWIALDGGIQVLDTKVFMRPATYNGSFIIHMNYKIGPGQLVSMPMYTPREGAVYSVSLFMADNPDGGPVAKSVRLTFIDIYGKRVGPKLNPFVVSNTSTTRNSIIWQTVSCNLRGTGVPASLYVESLTPGSFGPLVANIQINLASLLDNGSFEQIDPSVLMDNVTYFATLSAPSTMISKWTVEAGVVKIASAARYQAATDNTATMLDLNANDSPATISTIFSVRMSTEYTLLFDTAANPEQAQSLTGQILVMIDGLPSSTRLLSKQVDLDSTGYSIDSIGWNTIDFSFKTVKDDFQVKVSFKSNIPGSFGPLLDNVAVYEVTKSLKDTNETLSAVPPSIINSRAHLDAHAPRTVPLILFLVLFSLHLL